MENTRELCIQLLKGNETDNLPYNYEAIKTVVEFICLGTPENSLWPWFPAVLCSNDVNYITLVHTVICLESDPHGQGQLHLVSLPVI